LTAAGDEDMGAFLDEALLPPVMTAIFPVSFDMMLSFSVLVW